MSYTQDISRCLHDQVEFGVRDEELARYLDKLVPGLRRLQSAYRKHRLPLLHLPERKDDLAPLLDCAGRYRAAFKDVVVLGTGGSSLGAQALYNVVNTGYGGGDRNPRLHIVPNIDPYTFSALLRSLNLRRTGFIVISKSGSTAETLLQFTTVVAHMREALDDVWLKRAVTVVTQPGDNPMRRLAAKYDLPVLDHDPNVGGRYSVFSLVGVLPALIAGLDVRALRAGAASVVHEMLSVNDPFEATPAVGAALAVAMEQRRHITTSVMLAYTDRLNAFTQWYRQLWAESLGKKGKGTTPFCAIGPLDQHSQLQLWLDGPADKFFTILTVAEDSQYLPGAQEMATDPQMAYLADTDLGDLMDVMCLATTQTLARNGRPVRTLRLNALDEYSLGALMMHFMLETILSAELMGVNPYDQPAVEQGKGLVRNYLRLRQARHAA